MAKRQREKAKRIGRPAAGREAEGSRQQTGKQWSRICCGQKRVSKLSETVNSLWQVADKLLPQATRVSISHACKRMTNGFKGGAEAADGDGIVVAGSHVVANSQLAVFRLPLLQLQPNCCDGNLFLPAAVAVVAASCDAVCCTWWWTVMIYEAASRGPRQDDPPLLAMWSSKLTCHNYSARPSDLKVVCYLPLPPFPLPFSSSANENVFNASLRVQLESQSIRRTETESILSNSFKRAKLRSSTVII